MAPKLPVIHIASAVQLFLQLAFPSIDRLGRETFLFNQRVVECVICAAEYHASIITNTNGLPIAKRILYVYGYVRYYDLVKVIRRIGLCLNT
jgi:hypothetical protein